jgi:hypothetical protein
MFVAKHKQAAHALPVRASERSALLAGHQQPVRQSHWPWQLLFFTNTL